MSYKGIDVAKWQGVIDWKQVKAAGVNFAIPKCINQSLKYDSQFLNNVKGCNEQGIDWDTYKYIYGLTLDEQLREADACLNAIIKANAKETCTLWWDMEYDKLGALGKPKLTTLTNRVKEVVENAGVGFGIYLNKDWSQNKVDVSSIDTKYWIARYPNQNPMTLADMPNEALSPKTFFKGEAFGWQYSSKGNVPGIDGVVDLNIIFADETTTTANGNPYPIPTYDLFQRRLCQNPEFVKWLQYALNHNGQNIKIDGKFGPKTDTALKNWQYQHPTTFKDQPDGICGPLSRKLLGA